MSDELWQTQDIAIVSNHKTGLSMVLCEDCYPKADIPNGCIIHSWNTLVDANWKNDAYQRDESDKDQLCTICHKLVSRSHY